MATKGKRRKNQTGKRTVKISAENHKKLNLHKVENEFRSMDEALGDLLQNNEVSEPPEPTGAKDKIST